MSKQRKFWVSREELFDILESGRFPLPQFHEDYLNQAVKTTSSPTFAGLTITNNITVGGTVDGVDVAALKTDVDGFHDDLKNLTATEIEELARIGATTISIAQWGYLGACSAGGGQLLAALTAAESTQLEAIGGATISAAQWGYLGAMGDWLDQAVKVASTPTFAGVVIDGGDISIKEAQKIVNADNVSAYFQMPVSDVATISDKAFKFYDYVTAKYIQVDIPAGYVSFATDEAYYKFDKVVMATSFHLPAGVTPNIGWLSDVNIDEWEQGETLLWDTDTMQLVDAWGVEYDNPRLVWKMYTEFMGYDAMSSPPWTGGGIAGGTKAGISGLANHPGIMNFLSGTTINSGYRYAIENDAILLAGKESTEFIFQMKTNTDTRVKLGFIDTYSSGNPVDGVWLEILAGTLTGKTANNSAISTTGTNFPIVEDTWYRVKLFINNAMTLVTYSIYTCADDTIRWTDTLAANIPTARVTGHGIIATHDEEYVVSIIWVDMMTANRAGAWNR